MLTYINVTGHFKTSNGQPVEGSIKFVPSTISLVGSNNSVITTTPITVRLNKGDLFVQLLAVDDPNITPKDWTYTVTELFSHRDTVRTYSIAPLMQHATTGLNISEVAPVTNSAGTPILIEGVPGPQGAPGTNNTGQPKWSGQGPPGAIIGAAPGDDYLDNATGNIYTLL